MGSETLPEITVYHPLYHPQMQVKVRSHEAHTPLSLGGKSHSKRTEAKWKTILWSNESKMEILFGKHGRHILWSKEQRDHPA